MKKVQRNGFLIKIDSVGDSITPVYRFRLYLHRKNWFPQFLHVEHIHRDRVETIDKSIDNVIAKYREIRDAWKGIK